MKDDKNRLYVFVPLTVSYGPLTFLSIAILAALARITLSGEHVGLK